jgi:uncharacterized delta-60 repeat protein
VALIVRSTPLILQEAAPFYLPRAHKKGDVSNMFPQSYYRSFRLGPFILCLVLLFIVGADAQADLGVLLDPTFGGKGMVRTVFRHGYDYPTTSALQPDGKLVVVGSSSGYPSQYSDFSVARFNSDGSPDLTFGPGGYVTTPFRDGYSGAAGVVVQPDGKIVVVGTAYCYSEHYADFAINRLAIARYNFDGSLDPTFGSNGKLMLNTDPSVQDDDGGPVFLQDDGKILILDRVFGTSALIRLDSDGSIDETFGNAGKFIPGRNLGSITSLTILPDGKLLAGSYEGATGHFAVMRLNSDGSYDTTFGDAGLAVAQYFQGSAIALLPTPNGQIMAGCSNGVLRLNSDGSIDLSYGQFAYGFAPLPPSSGYDMELMSDDKVLVISWTGNADTPGNLLLRRLATSGEWDMTYGINGSVMRSFPKSGFGAMRIDGNGKMIFTGVTASREGRRTALLRLNTDGSVDSTYGSGGIGGGPTSEGESFAVVTRIQPDGKILVGGNDYAERPGNSAALARYNEDGSMDTSFAGTGKVESSVSGFVIIDMQLAPDGKIVLFGTRGNTMAVLRYLANGSLDKSFGLGGAASTTLTSFGAGGWIEPDGRIVVVGVGRSRQFGLTRLTADGSVDTTYGPKGTLLMPRPSDPANFNAMTRQPDGKILLVGTLYQPSTGAVGNILVRYSADGSFDSTFNGTGIVTTPFEQGSMSSSDVKVQPDGKIVVLGSSGYLLNGHDDFQYVLIRYNSDGSLDTTFNGHGQTAASIGETYGYASAFAILPNGKYIVTGYRLNNDPNNRYNALIDKPLLMRFREDGSIDGLGGMKPGIVAVDLEGGTGFLNYDGHAPSSLAVDASGRVIFVGNLDSNFGIFRLKADDTPITTKHSERAIE